MTAYQTGDFNIIITITIFPYFYIRELVRSGMVIRKLQPMGGGSAGFTLPKEDLRDLGLFEDDEIEESYARIERTGVDEFRIKFID